MVSPWDFLHRGMECQPRQAQRLPDAPGQGRPQRPRRGRAGGTATSRGAASRQRGIPSGTGGRGVDFCGGKISPFIGGKSPFIMGKWRGRERMGKWPFIIGKSQFIVGK